MADVTGEARCEARPRRSPPLPSLLPWARPRRNARERELPALGSQAAPPGSSRRALLPGPGHRPTPSWANGNAAQAPPILIGPMGARHGLRPDPAKANSGVGWQPAAPAGRSGRQGTRGWAAAGSAPLPSDPVSRFSVFLFQTTWTRRGCEAAGRSAGRLGRCRRCRLGSRPPRGSEVRAPQPPAGRAHGDSGALAQLRGLQLLAPAPGPVDFERAPRQNPKDSGQRRQPRPPR